MPFCEFIAARRQQVRRNRRYLFIATPCLVGLLIVYALRLHLSAELSCVALLERSANASATAAAEVSACIRELSDISDAFKDPVEWFREKKGLVDAFLFVTYVAIQKHWPLLAVLIGSKRLLLGFLTMSLLSHLLQPLAVILSRDVTTWTFTLLRFFNDVATAGYFPACVALLNKWAPPQERLLMLCIEFSALYLSIFFTSAACSFSCTTFGGPAVFYSLVAISALCLALCFVLLADSPDKSRWISDEERELIISPPNGPAPAPEAQLQSWKALLKSFTPQLKTLMAMLASGGAELAIGSDFGSVAFFIGACLVAFGALLSVVFARADVEAAEHPLNV